MATETHNLGIISWAHKGEWTAGTYKKNHHVTYEGEQYVSKVDNNTANPTDATKWQKVSDNSKYAEHGYEDGEERTTNKELEEKLKSIDILVRSEKFYGIEWKDTQASTACKRIGNLDLHRQLPIQSQMKRCLLLDDGAVNYYPEADNTNVKSHVKMEVSILFGYDGQVMVKIPGHWERFDKDGIYNRALISEYPLDGFHFVPEMYVSAYQATIDRTDPSKPKLASVMNTTPEFRGGNNNATNDGNYNTLLGMPATALSLLNFRAYARNRGAAGMDGAGWNCYLYEAHKTISWLYFIEYANFNCQLDFNAEPDANGYKQGGLGAGVTNLLWTNWGNYNGNYPFVPCGYTNALGNATGVVPFTFAPEAGLTTQISVPSYRGIENPFGHIWHWTDGVRIKNNSDEEGGECEFFTCDNPALFHSTDFSNYIKRGNLPTENGWIKKMLIGEFGETLPKEIGGGSTTYFADYYYCSDKPASGSKVRGLFAGSHASYGSSAGLSCASTVDNVLCATAYIGSRLCFIP